jgi:predicted RNA-binding protein (virulence factor B family)
MPDAKPNKAKTQYRIFIIVYFDSVISDNAEYKNTAYFTIIKTSNTHLTLTGFCFLSLVLIFLFMPLIGKFNKLKVVKEFDFGLYLDGAELGEILLPRRYVPEGCKIDDEVDVFIYFDSNDRIILTTEIPFASVGEFALLHVKTVDEFGAFLDWGLMKDLLVPFREQKVPLTKGRSCVVYVFYDEKSNRIAASAKVEKHLNLTPPAYSVGEEVDLLIWKATDLGYKVIINNAHQGILYTNEVFQELAVGQKMKGFIKKVRDDLKIDVGLFPSGYANIKQNSDAIISYLEHQGGYADISDKTPAEIIHSLFGISKKTFKKIIGDLYSQRIILIEKEGIRLVSKPA